MPIPRSPGVLAVFTLLASLLTGLPGFGATPLLAAGAASPQRPMLQAATADAYDLKRDEALGGHTLERHVGRTDRDLAERLRREPQISAASTYTDQATAERVVGAAVRQSEARIRAWARGGGGSRPNLVLNYSEPNGRAIGRSLSRRARVSIDASRALVVLRWLPREQRWIVLTSYPEAR